MDQIRNIYPVLIFDEPTSQLHAVCIVDNYQEKIVLSYSSSTINFLFQFG